MEGANSGCFVHRSSVSIRFHPFTPTFSHPVERPTPGTFQLQLAVPQHPFEQVFRLPLTQTAQRHHLGALDLPVLA